MKGSEPRGLVCFVWAKGDARDVEIVDYHKRRETDA